jgi:hypothetical protein
MFFVPDPSWGTSFSSYVCHMTDYWTTTVLKYLQRLLIVLNDSVKGSQNNTRNALEPCYRTWICQQNKLLSLGGFLTVFCVLIGRCPITWTASLAEFGGMCKEVVVTDFKQNMEALDHEAAMLTATPPLSLS